MAKGQGLLAVGILLASWSLMRANVLLEDELGESVVVVPQIVSSQTSDHVAAIIPAAQPRERMTFYVPTKNVGTRPTPSTVIVTKEGAPRWTVTQLAIAPAMATERTPGIVFHTEFEPIPPKSPDQIAPPVYVELPDPRKPRSKPLQGSAWMLVRGGGQAAFLPGSGQLGGPQIGARLRWPITEFGRSTDLAATVRASSALFPGASCRCIYLDVLASQRFARS